MGIDVYHGTGFVDWAKVKEAGNIFGVVKATEGTSLVDINLSENLKGLASNNMIRGAYHFYKVGLDPLQQAAHFVNACVSRGYDTKKDMPLCLDIEDRDGLANTGVARMRSDVSIFVSYVEKQVGRKMIIYCDADYGDHLMGDYAGHPLWLAQYTSASKPTRLPLGWKTWTLWQWNEYGHVSGVYGNYADMDRFNGTQDQFIAWAKS
jgi:lysozyme